MGLFKNTNKGIFGGALKRGLNSLVGSGVVSGAVSFLPGGGIISNALNSINNKIGTNSSTVTTVDKPLPDTPTGTTTKNVKVNANSKSLLILGGIVLAFFLLKK